MAGQLTLHVDGYFANPFDATVFVALTEKQLPFGTARALLREGQGLPPGLASLTAISRVPALQHGDFFLTESIAIAEYLERVFPERPIFPRDPRGHARALQIMAWVRIDLAAMRWERPWYTSLYPTIVVSPLSPLAAREAAELVDVVARLDAQGDLATWNIAHVDLAFTIARLRDEVALPERVAAFVARTYARPAVRAYIDHPRPPPPPP